MCIAILLQYSDVGKFFGKKRPKINNLKQFYVYIKKKQESIVFQK